MFGMAPTTPAAVQPRTTPSRRCRQLAGIVDLVRQPPTHSESRHLGIATHPDNDARRVRRQALDQLVDVEGRTEKCELLGLCLLEIVWGKRV